VVHGDSFLPLYQFNKRADRMHVCGRKTFFAVVAAKIHGVQLIVLHCNLFVQRNILSMTQNLVPCINAYLWQYFSTFCHCRQLPSLWCSVKPSQQSILQFCTKNNNSSSQTNRISIEKLEGRKLTVTIFLEICNSNLQTTACISRAYRWCHTMSTNILLGKWSYIMKTYNYLRNMLCLNLRIH